MSEEEIIKIIKEYLSKEYIECTKIGAVSIPNEEWYAIQGLLDLYEEKNKQIQVEIEGRNVLVNLNENLKEELKKEKEKNKRIKNSTLIVVGRRNGKNFEQKLVLEEYIHKDKIKEIIYPTPDNPISFEIQTSAMYKKLEQLLEEE